MATATEARERGILFSGPMVRAILDGRKTQTRRVVIPQPAAGFGEPHIGPGWVCAWWRVKDDHNDWHDVRLPYQPGDRLYVRETWRVMKSYDDLSPKESVHFVGVDCEGFVQYQAEGIKPDHIGHWGKWRPSIYMPKPFSRIWLDVTGVRVERVQDATESDCIAEGAQGVGCEHGAAELTGAGYNCTDCMNSGWIEPPGLHFMEIWDSINAHRAPWSDNPWVWVISFEVCDR